MTLDRAYVAAFHAIDRDSVYVSMTRHRHVAQLFVNLGRLGPSKRKSRHDDPGSDPRRQAFLAECLRPSIKLNAVDFVADLQGWLKGSTGTVFRNGPGYRYAKPDVEARMLRRASQNLGEAAILSDPITQCGMPNIIYNRLMRPVVDGPKRRGVPVLSVRDWLSNLIVRVKELSYRLRPAPLAQPSEKPRTSFKLRVKTPSFEINPQELAEKTAQRDTVEPDFP